MLKEDKERANRIKNNTARLDFLNRIKKSNEDLK